jgi:protein SCO1/2
MAPRLRLALAVTAILLFAGVAGAAAWIAGERTAERAGFAGALRPPTARGAELTGLRDEDGRAVSLRALRGRPVVVTFLYTRCEDSCPVIADQVRSALDELDEDVPAIAVSVDPEGDTRARAKRFLVEHRLLGRMSYLTGDEAALARQWRAYGIQPQAVKEGEDHSVYVVLLDGQGRQRIGFPYDRLTPEDLAHDIRALRAAASS